MFAYVTPSKSEYLSGLEGWLAPAAETIKTGGGKLPFQTLRDSYG